MAWTEQSQVVIDQEFNGSSDFIDLGDTNDPSGSYTIEAEIRPDSLVGSQNGHRILSKEDGTTGWALSIGDNSTAGRLRSFNREASDFGLVDADGVIVLSTWQHVAVVYDSSDSSVKIYYDLILKTTGSMDSDTVDNSHTMLIGAQNDGSGGHTRFFDGKMRRVRLWTRALSLSELTLYNGKDVDVRSVTGLAVQRIGWTSQ